jgi:hypothetical protein
MVFYMLTFKKNRGFQTPTSRLTPGNRLWGALQKLVKYLRECNTAYPSASGELKCLTNGQLREVYVNLRLVNALSSEIIMHGLLWDTLIIQIRVVRDKKSISFSGDGLQQCRAATAGVSNVALSFRVFLTSPVCLVPQASLHS